MFTPLRPLYKVENAFARLGIWRRLSRCYEQAPLGARTWLEVACVAYRAGGFGPSRPDGGAAAVEEPGQQSNTNQHSSLRNRWSSSTRSRISRGS